MLHAGPICNGKRVNWGRQQEAAQRKMERKVLTSKRHVQN